MNIQPFSDIYDLAAARKGGKKALKQLLPSLRSDKALRELAGC